MKRFWSLLLALALLASIVVVPVSAETEATSAPTLTLDASAFTYSTSGQGSITPTAAQTTYKEGDQVLLTVKIAAGTQKLYFKGCTLFIKYDSSIFEPFTFETADEETRGPAYSALDGWSCAGGIPEDAKDYLVSCSMGTSGNGKPLNPGEEAVTVVYFMFKV